MPNDVIEHFSIRYCKGIGPAKEAAFNKIGVASVKDLLYTFPSRYEDRSHLKKISQLKDNEPVLIKAKVMAKNLRKAGYGWKFGRVKSIFEVIVDDGSAKAVCVWFNQHFLSDSFKVGQEIFIYGKATWQNPFKFISPEYEIVDEKGSLNMNRIVSVYPLTASLTQKFLRKTIAACLDEFKTKLSDPLPFFIREERKLPNIAAGLEDIHFPPGWPQAMRARERFIFEELFFSQVMVYLRKSRHRMQKGLPMQARQDFLNQLEKNIPFKLTDSQAKVFEQIKTDLTKPYPMRRLLQGDVGCGKTVVAAFTLGVCADCGYQAALMVPTEVLAYQHKESLDKIFKDTGIIVKLLTSASKDSQKIHQELKEGKINIIVGTHALLSQEVEFKNLGLAIIDEQHKFGVAQRALLPKKSSNNPHYLVMSATPIPRSLALSLYGDLDISVINQMPLGRTPSKNIWMKEKQRKQVYEMIRLKVKEGRQVYIVYPLIEETEDEDLKSLEEMFERVSKEFSEYKTGMFHGRLKSSQKLKVIEEFKASKIQILVSTTVVEVGVSIANATMMVVENPERFGLAQLHQLRGRIQRSANPSDFILLSPDELNEVAIRRIQTIISTSDGFKIAEEDLLARGPGDFFGAMQHGLPFLRIANPLRDLEILKDARLAAYIVVKDDPYLEKPPHKCLRENIDFNLINSVKVDNREVMQELR